MARTTDPNLSEVFITVATTEVLDRQTGAVIDVVVSASGPYSATGPARTAAKRATFDASASSYFPRRSTAKVLRSAVTWEPVE